MTKDSNNKNPPSLERRVEPEMTGSWSHPYILYIVITLALFVVLLVIAFIAKTSGWIPQR